MFVNQKVERALFRSNLALRGIAPATRRFSDRLATTYVYSVIYGIGLEGRAGGDEQRLTGGFPLLILD